MNGTSPNRENGTNAQPRRLNPVNTEPVLTGLIGMHIGASRSPEMHMREAEAQGFQLIYKLFDLPDPKHDSDALSHTLDTVEADGFSGVNITHPFKQFVMSLLDELSDEAREIGAVNTVLFRSGKRIGHNTDCYGFEESFRRQLPEASLDKPVQFGAGGAGAATAVAMLRLGCQHLCIYDIDSSRSEDLVKRFQDPSLSGRISVVRDVTAALEDASGLINATPVGMTSHPGTPVETRLLKQDMWVADVVYFPLETQLLKEARALGCRVADGGQMAVFQAALAFDLFTGRVADRSRMAARFPKR